MTPHGFAGRTDFQRLLTEALAWAGDQGQRELHAWDASFVDWPLSDAATLAALTAWARPGRQLHLLALQYTTSRGAIRASCAGGAITRIA